MDNPIRTCLAAATGLALLLAGGVAVAQVPNPPPPPPPGADTPPGGPPGAYNTGAYNTGGPHGEPMRHGRMGEMMRMRMPPPSKAAHFHFRKGDARVDIKCADDEPMKACVDAGTALLDKLAAQPR